MQVTFECKTWWETLCKCDASCKMNDRWCRSGGLAPVRVSDWLWICEGERGGDGGRGEAVYFPAPASMPCPGGVLLSAAWKWWIRARANAALFWQVVHVWCVGELPLLLNFTAREKCYSRTGFSQILDGVHMKNKWVISISSAGHVLTLLAYDMGCQSTLNPPKWERERRGLSSVHVALFLLATMTIGRVQSHSNI